MATRALVGASRDAFAAQVGDALANLHDHVHLQSHPLVDVLPSAAPEAPVARSSGGRLREELLAGIAALEPGAGPETPSARRRHQALVLRYVACLDVPEVTRRLAISRRQFYYERSAALDALVLLLRERWGLDRPPPQPRLNDASAQPETSLPTPSTSFVGRQHSVEGVMAALAHARVLTLTGPPGTGKTRLAIAAARALAARSAYPGGVHFVPLASVTEADLVVPTIAHALGAAETDQLSPCDALVRHLQGRRRLVVLDNLEQVAPAGRELATVAAACPEATFLLTSRSPLHVPGEQEWPVAPMALPDPSHSPELDQLLAYEAIRLFVERARAHTPGFALSPEQGAVVERICRRLDGLPLAIELAAARTRVLTVEGLEARLDDVYRLLDGAGGAAQPGWRGLRAAMDGSYALLSAEEQMLLRRMSVFADGCSLDALASVCGVPEPLQRLGRLIEHSLVVPDLARGEARYRLLETVRQYAAERLREAREEHVLRDAHLDWCRAQLACTDAEAFSVGRIRLVGREHANLRAALRWAVESEHVEAGFRLLRAMLGFWNVRSQYAEGRGWFAELASVPGGDEPTPARAGALAVVGQLAYCQADFDAAESYLRESISIYQRHQHAAGIALATNALGNVWFGRGQLSEAEACYECALIINRRIDEHFWAVTGSFALARTLVTRGDLTGARHLAEEALATARRFDYPWIASRLLRTLGRIAAEQGDHAAARELFEDGLAVQRALGDSQGESQTLISLAESALAARRTTAARQLYVEALRRAFAAGQTREMVHCLEGLAAQSSPRELRRSVRIAAAADEIRRAAGGVPWPRERARLERWRETARRRLDPGIYAAADASGRGLSIEQVVELAVAEA